MAAQPLTLEYYDEIGFSKSLPILDSNGHPINDQTKVLWDKAKYQSFIDTYNKYKNTQEINLDAAMKNLRDAVYNFGETSAQWNSIPITPIYLNSIIEQAKFIENEIDQTEKRYGSQLSEKAKRYISGCKLMLYATKNLALLDLNIINNAIQKREEEHQKEAKWQGYLVVGGLIVGGIVVGALIGGGAAIVYFGIESVKAITTGVAIGAIVGGELGRRTGLSIKYQQQEEYRKMIIGLVSLRKPSNQILWNDKNAFFASKNPENNLDPVLTNTPKSRGFCQIL